MWTFVFMFYNIVKIHEINFQLKCAKIFDHWDIFEWTAHNNGVKQPLDMIW